MTTQQWIAFLTAVEQYMLGTLSKKGFMKALTANGITAELIRSILPKETLAVIPAEKYTFVYRPGTIGGKQTFHAECFSDYVNAERKFGIINQDTGGPSFPAGHPGHCPKCDRDISVGDLIIRRTFNPIQRIA